jgi:hypothetical protein
VEQVVLDGALAQGELLGDGPVRTPFGEDPEHLPIAARQAE